VVSLCSKRSLQASQKLFKTELEKNQVFGKNQPFGFFGFLCFLCFFYIFAQKREFLGISVSRILLGASRL
jgi:hypothetical protein